MTTLKASISAADYTSMVAVEVDLGSLAAHPANPRVDLGDLTELKASIAQVGILEPLVVVTAAAHSAAGWPVPEQSGTTYVILAGHRRQRAALAAGLSSGPAVVRDDLAGDKALIVMLSENGDGVRKGLEPLAEARAMQQLVERGWSQRQIARELGCAQGQVSKRLTLLRLPEQAQQTLAAGKITTADAGELARLNGDETRTMNALRAISEGWKAKQVVDRHLEDRRRDAEREQARAQLVASGLTVVDPDRLKHGRYAHRLYPDINDDGDDLTPHREAECLVAAVGYNACPEYYCRAPEKHPPQHQPRSFRRSSENGALHAADEAKEAKLAQRRRTEAGMALATKLAYGAGALSPAAAAPVLADAVLLRDCTASTLKTAVRWIRELGHVEGDPYIGQTSKDEDAYAYVTKVRSSGNQGLALRLALVMSVVACEEYVRYQSHAWDRRVLAYYERLTTWIAYEPTEWETSRLETTRGKLDARVRLACATCGCRHNAMASGHHYCDVREDGSLDGGWVYHCAYAKCDQDK